MKKLQSNLSIPILVFILCVSSFLVLKVEALEDSWTTLTPMQVERTGLGVVAVDGKIYAIGGRDFGKVDTVEEYDPQLNNWTYRTPIPEPMSLFAITVHHGKIYCFSSETGATYAYTPLYDTWENKTSLPNPRSGIKANTVNDKIYVQGGKIHSMDVYDPITDIWTTKTPMPVNAYPYYGWSCATVVLDGRIHVFGALPLEYSHQIYDPSTDSWSLGAPLIEDYYYSVAGVTTGVNAPKRIYIFGAEKWEWSVNVAIGSQSYDPKADTWIECASIPSGHLKGDAVVVDDRLYVIGGGVPFLGGIIDEDPLNSLYTPIGFGTPDPAYVPPEPTPTPTISPTPTPSLSPTPTSTLEPESFPTTLVIASVAIVVIVGLGIILYYKKRRS